MLKILLVVVALSLQGCANHSFNSSAPIQQNQTILVVAQFPEHFQIHQNLFPIFGSQKIIRVDVSPWQVNQNIEVQLQSELKTHYHPVLLTHTERNYSLPDTNFWNMPNLRQHALLQEAQSLGANYVLLAYPRQITRTENSKDQPGIEMQGLGIYQREHVVGRETLQHALIELALFDASTGEVLEKNYYQGSEIMAHNSEPIDENSIEGSKALTEFQQHQNQLISKALHSSLLELGLKTTDIANETL